MVNNAEHAIQKNFLFMHFPLLHIKHNDLIIVVKQKIIMSRNIFFRLWGQSISIPYKLCIDYNPVEVYTLVMNCFLRQHMKLVLITTF
jgi:hypothetical protein